MEPPGELDDELVGLPADNVIKPPYASLNLLCVGPADKIKAPPSPLFPELTESEIAPAMPSNHNPVKIFRVPVLPKLVLPVSILVSLLIPSFVAWAVLRLRGVRTSPTSFTS